MEWILYLLATHPDIQQRVYEATHPVQNMHKIPDIMKHVLKETLRLYPVAPFLNRTLSHDTTFKDFYLEANVSRASDVILNCLSKAPLLD